MKKKVISVLTALMVLTMSTTVFGATSPTTGTTTPVDTNKVNVATDATTAITEVVGATATTATEAEVANAANQAAAIVEEGYKAEVRAVIVLTPSGTPDENGNYNLTVTVPTLAAGTEVVILHIHNDGTVDQIPATVAADGKISFSVTDFSTFAIVEKVRITTTTPTTTPATTDEATSPKTGSPVVLPMMAAICLAGAGVCTKKVKFN